MRIVDYAQIVFIDANKFIMQIFNAPQLMWILFFFLNILLFNAVTAEQSFLFFTRHDEIIKNCYCYLMRIN